MQSHLRALAVTWLVWVGCSTGCRDDTTSRSEAPAVSNTSGAETKAPSLAPDPALAALAAPLVESAQKALDAIPDGAGPSATPYLTARQAIAAAGWLWRYQAPVGTEILLGPPVSSLETGGVLLLLDAALTEGDPKQVARYRAEASRALLHIAHEIERNPLSREVLAAALSGAVYDLGLRIVDGMPGAPNGPSATAADVAGAFHGVNAGAEALLSLNAPPAASRRVRQMLTTLNKALSGPNPIQRRADLAVLTGELGATLRTIARDLNLPSKLPYSPRVAVRGGGIDEPVHALTLPAPRTPMIKLARGERETLEALGEKLFFDKRLSGAGDRACSSCHQPQNAFADAMVRPVSLSPALPPLRHTPTLLYAPLFAAQFWDGKLVSREQQALSVIYSEREMALPVGTLAEVVGSDPSYRSAFAALSGGVSERNIARAISAFQSARLVPASAAIDHFARGDKNALSENEHRGFDVFIGPGRCARCHIPPSFGGVRPRDFSTSVFAVIGVPKVPNGKTVDDDLGRFVVTGQPNDRHSFKVPSVRNVAKTAPYFHHGAFSTLVQVIDFYDRGGIENPPIPLVNLDPDIHKLGLTDAERRDLETFMVQTLTDMAPAEPLE